MDINYILGVAVAIFCGVINNVGVLLQKKAVNEVPPESRGQGFMRRLLKNPRWLTGLVLQYGVGAAALIYAQDLIGPALVPGLMAAGLIVLAIGSVMLIGETLRPLEYAGIFLMIAGITLLGLSKLDISLPTVQASLALGSTLIRVLIFTAGLFILCGLTHFIALKSLKRKGVIMGLANGFFYALSNFWISPLLALFGTVLGGKGSAGQVALFAVASVILIATNLLAIRHIQEAFKFGQASNIIPVQQVSIQSAPVLVYFYVFALTPPTPLSGLLIVAGVLLIIVSGFLLGRRQSEMDSIH